MINRASVLLSAAFLVLFLATSGNCEENRRNGLHGNSWAFGQSSQRNDDIWHKGVDGATITKKARKSLKGNGPPDTSAGIDRALNEAGKDKKNSLGMSMSNVEGTWKVTPDQKQEHPDEHMFRDRRHIVRAFADVNAAEGLNFSIGPELSIKDEGHAAESATEDQPESAFGVGMRFKYDF